MQLDNFFYVFLKVFLSGGYLGILALRRCNLLFELTDFLPKLLPFRMFLPNAALPPYLLFQFLIIPQQQFLIPDHLLLDHSHLSYLFLQNLIPFRVVLLNLVDGAILFPFHLLVDSY